MLVGRDSFGNAYYENRRYPHSASRAELRHPKGKLTQAAPDRERWVMYAKTDDYKANMVPPEWHGAASEAPLQRRC